MIEALIILFLMGAVGTYYLTNQKEIDKKTKLVKKSLTKKIK
jgi:hypothetical protein